MTSEWRKSTRSQGNQQSDCVETRASEGAFQVRDSKLGETSPIFDLDTPDFTSLLSATQR